MVISPSACASPPVMSSMRSCRALLVASVIIRRSSPASASSRK
jgi:hypothetical protein